MSDRIDPITSRPSGLPGVGRSNPLPRVSREERGHQQQQDDHSRQDYPSPDKGDEDFYEGEFEAELADQADDLDDWATDRHEERREGPRPAGHDDDSDSHIDIRA